MKTCFLSGLLPSRWTYPYVMFFFSSRKQENCFNSMFGLSKFCMSMYNANTFPEDGRFWHPKKFTKFKINVIIYYFQFTWMFFPRWSFWFAGRYKNIWDLFLTLFWSIGLMDFLFRIFPRVWFLWLKLVKWFQEMFLMDDNDGYHFDILAIKASV